ncbi:MAG TPA: hypothetical protein VJ841_04815 [Candidatus Saccharimonadales bacterium]|nr:hypothetical protein [Candidatus Saccharimonadales bacterium]
MPQNISIQLTNHKIETRKIYTESGRLVITTPDSGIDGLSTIVERQVTGATLSFRSFRRKDEKGVSTYDIKLVGSRNLTLSALVEAIRSYLDGNREALRKVNEQ